MTQSLSSPIYYAAPTYYAALTLKIPAAKKIFMREKERIEKDLREFAESLHEIEEAKPPENLRENIERAKNYYKDAVYFLEKGDTFTAWGTINYAHGVLDAVRRSMGLECYGALK